MNPINPFGKSGNPLRPKLVSSNQMQDPAGYKGEALRFLNRAKAEVGDVLQIETDSGNLQGTLVPRYIYGGWDKVVLKLVSGYNIGVSVTGLKGAKVVSKGEKPKFSAPPSPREKGELPRVLILGTGGTIASRIDYRTGGVHPAVSAEELHSLIPELSDIARVEPEIA